MAKTVTKTGYTGGTKEFSNGLFYTGIELAANETPYRIDFGPHAYPSGSYYGDRYPQGGGGNHRINFVLCDSANKIRILLFTIGWDPNENYVTTPSYATFDNGAALRGKKLYISPEGSDVSKMNTYLANNCKVTVKCTADSYSVSTVAYEGGSLSSSAASAYPGDTVTVTASPSSGYALNSIWSNQVTLSGSGNTRTFTMPYGNVAVSADFTRISYGISTSAGTGGVLSSSASRAYPGDTITVTAYPSYGYVLNNITSSDVTLSGSGDSRSFTMPSKNVSVSADFTRLSYSISTSAGTGGTLTASKSTAYPGETITVTANNNQGYSLTSISSSQVTLSGSGNTRTFTMPYGNVSVSAEFQRLAYSVSTGAGTGGSLAASATSVYPGNTVTLTAYPASGYVLNDITASGATLSGSGNTRTFVMPYNNVSAYATFTLIHTLVWSSSKSLSFSQSDNNVTVTLSGSAVDNYGNTVTYNLYKNGSYVKALSGGKATVSLSAGELGTNITYKVVATAGGLSADGPSASFKAVTHTLGWTNASLSGSQSGKQVTMTFGGYATDSWGKPISYYLYKENGYVGTFSGNSMTITLDVSELGVSKQYKVVAAAGGLTADGRAIAFTCASPTVTWDSGAQMYGQEIEENYVRVGVTRVAHIDNGYTGTVYYRVYIENVRENEDGDTRREWTLQPLQLGAAQTYKIDAYAVIEGMVISSQPFTMVITVEEKSRTVRYYDGQWHLVVMHWFDGTDFVEVEPYYYDGNEWILCSMT